MKKILFYITSVIIIIFFGFSLPVFSFFPLFFVIFVGLYKGSTAGCTVGFFLGLFNGIFSTAMMGIDGFTYSIVGYLAGILPDRIDENNILIQIAISLISVILVGIMTSIIEILFISTGNPLRLLHFDKSVLLTILSPAMFFVFKKWWKMWFGKLITER